jgi:hypothetical protein
MRRIRENLVVVHHPHVPNLEDEEKHEVAVLAAGAEPSPVAKSETAQALVPKPGSKWIKLGMEVVLISLGVFFALMGEQWREATRDRELAEDALRRLRSEVQTNQKAVAAVREYHVVTLKGLEAYLAADDKARAAMSVKVEGIRPAYFDSTAWDLALANGALVHMDSDVAFRLSRIYGQQRRYEGLTEGITHAMYLRPPSDGPETFFPALAVFYNDLIFWEPELLRLYNEVLPQIDRALRE